MKGSEGKEKGNKKGERREGQKWEEKGGGNVTYRCNERERGKGKEERKRRGVGKEREE